MSLYRSTVRLCAGFGLVLAIAPLAGCASTGLSSFKMPIFTETTKPTGSVSRTGGSDYASERAYYEQYSRNGYSHQGLKPPAHYPGKAAAADKRHDVIPNEVRQQANYDPRKVGPEPNWHGGTTPVAEEPRTFRVQQGDTIDWIARVHNVSVSDLMRANRLREARVVAGQNLVIPAEVSANPFGASAVQPVSTQHPVGTTEPPRHLLEGGLSPDGKSYVVEPGDTFYSIARNNRVDPMKLADVNRIDDTSSIRPGQKLVLPQRW